MPQRTRDTSGQYIREPLEVRFWRLVDQSRPDGCWPFTGTRTKDGYGVVYKAFPGVGYTVASRVAWILTQGEIPEGLVIRHTCDNPACCNPDHLLLGTQAENIADKVARNRQARGERIHTAKLTAEQVRDIRARYAPGLGSALAVEYGIGRTTVNKIVRRHIWRHV